MTIEQQLEANWQNGYYSVIEYEHSLIGIVNAKYNNDFRFSGFCIAIEIAKNYIGNKLLIEGDLQNCKIIGTIHPSELMGPGMKFGQKVRVKENAKEECEKSGLGWNRSMEEMVGEICEVFGKIGSDYKIYTPDKSDWWNFPPTALEPVYEDEEKADWLEKGKKEGWVKDGNVVV